MPTLGSSHLASCFLRQDASLCFLALRASLQGWSRLRGSLSPYLDRMTSIMCSSLSYRVLTASCMLLSFTVIPSSNILSINALSSTVLCRSVDSSIPEASNCCLEIKKRMYSCFTFCFLTSSLKSLGHTSELIQIFFSRSVNSRVETSCNQSVMISRQT